MNKNEHIFLVDVLGVFTAQAMTEFNSVDDNGSMLGFPKTQPATVKGAVLTSLRSRVPRNHLSHSNRPAAR